MAWACITHNRKRHIIRLNMVPEATTTTGKKGGSLNGLRYGDQILQGSLKEFLDTAKEEESQEVLVVEDGAPVTGVQLQRTSNMNWVSQSLSTHHLHQT